MNILNKLNQRPNSFTIGCALVVFIGFLFGIGAISLIVLIL
jgi:hypothetical protein